MVGCIFAPNRQHKCNNCGLIFGGLRVCVACKSAHYCSKRCQKAHWRQHKQECEEMAARAERAPTPPPPPPPPLLHAYDWDELMPFLVIGLAVFIAGLKFLFGST